MLVKTNATSIQQLKNQVKEWQNIEEIVNLIYIKHANPPKRNPLSMKSFDEFDVENRKIVLIEEYPCQNRKQPEKKDGENIEMIRTVLANVLLVGLERNIAMPQESITVNSKKY